MSHPKGLYLLFVTEMWERFSYYGMRAIFTLFMIRALLYDKEFASNIYGSYTGFVYLSPIIGGYVADRFWGNRRSILCGGVLMSIGQFLLFLSAYYYANLNIASPLLIIGLFFLIIGNGFFKPNISTMVGQLYADKDSRKDSAYTIFYMGINLGAIFSPLICGTLGDTGCPDDFKWGFLVASIGMIISTLFFYFLQNKYLISPEGESIGVNPNKKKDFITEKSFSNSTNYKRICFFIFLEIILFLIFYYFGSDISGAGIYSCSITVPLFIITDNSLTKIERNHILVIFIIAFFVIFFWAAYEQAGVSLTFFAKEQTNRNIGNYEMPTSYFQIFNAVFIVCLAPIFSMIWSFLNKHKMEPSTSAKQAWGLLLLSFGYLVIAIGSKDINSEIKVSMFWLIGLYFIHTLGELCLSPIGLSMVNRLSPARLTSLMMGVWFLSSSTANKFAGTLSSLYPDFNEKGELLAAKSFLGFQIDSLYSFFMIFVVMSGIAAIFMFFLSNKLEKMSK